MEAKFSPLYDKIINQLKTYQVYLVGGAIRDLLLGLPIHDYDFALPEGSITAAKEVADNLGGAFFILDKERETARVILTENGQRVVVDFTRLQGKDIEDDLRARDFTITSLALEVGGKTQVIDPLKGAQDLKDKVLRTSSKTALKDDPLRCIRAVRLAAHYQLQISSETKEQIRQFQDRLVDVSSERIRDEIFRLLEGPNQTAALQSMEILGLTQYSLPCSLSEPHAKTLRNLEELWNLFRRNHDQDSAANWGLALLVHRLGRYRELIKSLLEDGFVPGRTIYQLSFLAPLINEKTSKEDLIECRVKLPLSNLEWDFLLQSVQSVRQVEKFLEAGDELRPIDIYRYYRDLGVAGVAGVFLALASRSANLTTKEQQEDWIQKLDICRGILEGWWEKADQWVNPPVLITGYDLQEEFELKPGPQIGELLESLREAQVDDGFTSRDQALGFISDQLSMGSE